MSGPKQCDLDNPLTDRQQEMVAAFADGIRHGLLWPNICESCDRRPDDGKCVSCGKSAKNWTPKRHWG
jgi:hypothetical protein